MFEGRCPKCRKKYFGWALSFPRNQTCSLCGAALEVFKDGKKVSEGYSPFTAERYTIKGQSNVPTTSDTIGDKEEDITS